MPKAMSRFYLLTISMVLATLLALSACTLSLNQQDDREVENPALSDDIQPNPDLSPLQVVKIQVAALKHNDSDDRGIAVTFRFASPDNKQNSGPLRRFENMVKSPAYQAMLNHKSVDYDTMSIEGETAAQRVIFIQQNGKATVYIFHLSKQNQGSCPGCWMTDSVIVVPSRQQNLQGA